MKKALALALALLMLLALVACGGGGNTPAPSGGGDTPATQAPSGGGTPATQAPSGGGDKPAPQDTPSGGPSEETLSVASTVDYGNLNPLSISSVGYDAINCCMETLWECGLYDAYDDVRLRLAESLEADPNDPLHYTVKLKKGVTFSNGSEFKANDFMFSLKMYRDDTGFYATMKTRWCDFDKTKQVDDYTLELYTIQPDVTFQSVVAQIYMFDEETFDPDKVSEGPIGTGPYVITEYVINSHTVVERRDDYWDTLPYFKTITFHVIAEPSQRINALETGLVDVAPVDLADKAYVEEDLGLKTIPREGDAVILSLNTAATNEKMNNPVARAAICHAIDREAINQMVYYGLGRIMCAPWPNVIRGFTDDMKNLGVYAEGYNLELAKKEAEESGLVGKTLICVNNGNAAQVTVCEMIQDMLTQIGVTLELQSYDAATAYSITNEADGFDLSVGTFVGGNYLIGDQFKSLDMNKISVDPANWVGDSGKRFYEIVAKVHSSIDEERLPVLKECMDLYIGNVSRLGLVEYDSYLAVPAKLNVDEYWTRVLTTYYYRDFAYVE